MFADHKPLHRAEDQHENRQHELRERESSSHVVVVTVIVIRYIASQQEKL